jgi:hypothetical protein
VAYHHSVKITQIVFVPQIKIPRPKITEMLTQSNNNMSSAKTYWKPWIKNAGQCSHLDM